MFTVCLFVFFHGIVSVLSTCEYEYLFGIYLETMCQSQTEADIEKSRLCFEETISQSSLSDDGKYNIQKYGFDSKRDLVIIGKTLQI